MAFVIGNPIKPLFTVENAIIYTPKSSFGDTFMIFLHKKYPTIKDKAKNPIPHIKTSIVALAVSSLNSLDVTDDRIMQGVVTRRRRSTKNFVALLGMTFNLFITKPTAIIKNIDVIFDKIIAITKILYHHLCKLSSVFRFIYLCALDISHIWYIIIFARQFSISKLLVS